MTDPHEYGLRDKLASITIGGGTVRSFTYEKFWRMLTSTENSVTTTFAYDYEARLTSVTRSGMTTNTFTYNGLDTRVGKVDSGGTKTYKRDGAYVTDPVLSDGAATYTPGISERRSSTTKYALSNWLGSTSHLVASNESTTDTKQYDAFGNQTASSGTWSGPFHYGGPYGYQTDGDTGLKLLGHRYYDPTLGRFLTRDPMRAGRNWLVYCDNCPTAFADWIGLDKVLIIENPGGFGMGSHAIIGVEDKGGHRRYYGFYPSRERAGDDDGWSWYHDRTKDDGYIKTGDRPRKGATVKEHEVDRAVRVLIEKIIIRDTIKYENGKGATYDLKKHNCATWIVSVLERAFVDRPDGPPLPNRYKDIVAPLTLMHMMENWHD